MAMIDVPINVMAQRYVDAYRWGAVAKATEQITYDDTYRAKVVQRIRNLLGDHCDVCRHIIGRRSQRCFCPCHEVD